jgi:hypothetical protein
MIGFSSEKTLERGAPRSMKKVKIELKRTRGFRITVASPTLTCFACGEAFKEGDKGIEYPQATQSSHPNRWMNVKVHAGACDVHIKAVSDGSEEPDEEVVRVQPSTNFPRGLEDISLDRHEENVTPIAAARAS